MDPIDSLLHDFRTNGAASPDSLDAVERHEAIRLPADYREVMARTDGGEGFIGTHYLRLWRVAELLPFNRDYVVAQQAPGLLLFGSDGGGESFAFDTRGGEMTVVMAPFIVLSLADAIKVATNFTELLMRMHSGESLFH